MLLSELQQMNQKYTCGLEVKANDIYCKGVVMYQICLFFSFPLSLPLHLFFNFLHFKEFNTESEHFNLLHKSIGPIGLSN